MLNEPDIHIHSFMHARTHSYRAMGVSSAIVGASGAYIWVHPEAIGMDPETNGWVGEGVHFGPDVPTTRHQNMQTPIHFHYRWELSQAVLRGLRLAKTVVLIVADYKLRDFPLGGDGVGGGDKKMSKEAEAALVVAETGRKGDGAGTTIPFSNAHTTSFLDVSRPPSHAHDFPRHNATQRNKTELRETQNEYEALSYALRALDEEGGSPPAERARLEAKAKTARGALLAAAARLARVEEHAQVLLCVMCGGGS